MSRYARRLRSSPIRRTLLNLYRPLSRDPSLGGMCHIDASAILEFLDRVNETAPVKITISHVLIKMIGDSFRTYPELNVKVVGKSLYQLEHVDVRVSVNLFPEGQESPEVALAMVRDVDRKGLLQIAEELTSRAGSMRRTGASRNTLGKLVRLLRYVPDPLFNAAIELTHDVGLSGRLTAFGLIRDPMGSTVVTNVGSFGLPEGVSDLYVTGLLPPFGYASLFMVLPVEERPVVVDGEVVARPVLPLGAGMDHRAIDGYKIFKYFHHYADVLAHPDDYFDLSL